MESESKESLVVKKDDALASYKRENSNTVLPLQDLEEVELAETNNRINSANNNNYHDDSHNDDYALDLKGNKIETGDETIDSEAISTSKSPASRTAIATKNSSNNNKGKITHRSQSSPSSLTTHKFGLRPTPSPPRLIIDHKTGDIIESYPDQPVYLKTYQPLEDDNNNNYEEDDDSRTDDCTFDDSLAHPYPPPLSNQRQLEEYNKLLADQYGHQDPSSSTGGYISSEELAAMSGNNQSNRNSYRPVIPPPHSANNKVYFAPPVSSADHLLHNSPHGQLPHQMTDPFESDGHHQPYRHQQNPQQHQQQLASGLSNQRPQAAATSGPQYQVVEPHQISGSHNNSFKRALNKLNEAANTDIAIMTDLPEYGQDTGPSGQAVKGTNTNTNRAASRASGTNSTSGTGGFKVTATSASKGNSLLANKEQLKQQQPIQKLQNHKQQPHQHNIVPAIEDFNLYDFCFNFRTLLACLLSSLIIYLLVYPLSLDCTQYRPTYTYISIIVSSVNLICIIIFTLFWYCNGVTRTLYANLSSSAFIITIYSILVAINLALAILFFFINTCHFQRLIKTSSTPLIVAIAPSSTSPPTIDPDQPIAMPLIGFPPLRISESTLAILRATEEEQHREQQRTSSRRKRDLVDSENIMLLPLNSHRNQAYYVNQMDGVLWNEHIKNKINENNNNDNIIVSGKKHSSVNLIGETGNKQHPPYNELASIVGSRVFNRASFRLRRRRRWDDEDTAAEPMVSINQDHSLDGNPTLARGNVGYQGAYESSLPLPPALPPTTIDYYSESPVEAVWEYLKEQVVAFKRKFNQFLQQYDLKFIGALHALCAICLQYMAMKVAVVRSYFCSPVRAYI